MVEIASRRRTINQVCSEMYCQELLEDMVPSLGSDVIAPSLGSAPLVDVEQDCCAFSVACMQLWRK